jgi:hypothetical protein
MLKHIVDGPTPVERPPFLAAGLSANCVDFCKSCLHKKPEDRADHPHLLKHPFLEDAMSEASITVVKDWLQRLNRSCDIGAHDKY